MHRFDRREVEALARKRGLQIKPSGELAARVFAMFEQRRTFAAIVIETQQEPETILALWRRYRAGFDDLEETTTREEGERRAHEETLREVDAEFARRRRAD